MSFSTKAMPLNSHLHIVQKLGKARAAPVESRNTPASQPDREPASRRIPQTDVLPLLLSLACVGLVTAALLLLDQAVAVNLVPIAYLIPVIVAATQWGIWPATLASIASMAAADFFFFPPIFSFQVEDPQEVVDLMLFLVVALVSSNLASRLRRETDTLRQREKEIQNLYEFSRRLAACFTVSDLIAAVQTYLSRALGQPAVFFVAKIDGQFELPKYGSVPRAVQESVASLLTTVEAPARTIIDELTQSVWLLRTVGSETAV